MTKRIRASLTAKLLLITAGLLVASCVMTYALIAYMMPKTYRSALTEGLTDKVERLTEMLEETTRAEYEPLVDQFVQETRTEVTITDLTGNEVLYEQAPYSQFVYNGVYVSIAKVTDADVAMDEGTGDALQEEAVAVEADAVEDTTFSVYAGQSMTLGGVFQFADAEDPYMLSVYDTMREVNDAAEALHRIFPLLALAILAMALLGAFIYSRYVTRPIVRISRLSQRLAALDFTWAYESARSDEIGVLGRGLSELAARLAQTLEELRGANEALRGEMAREREVRRQRATLFSAVSHELKTPITIIKGQLEGMIGNVGAYADRDKYLSRALSVAESMEGMVCEMLALSKAEDALDTVNIRPLDLGGMMQARLSRHAELFAQRGIHVSADIAPVVIHADHPHIEKVLDNILSNAALHSPQGATVWVTVRREGTDACVSVENSGTRIPEENPDRLFEAFYRVDASRNRQTGGTGLGLYIVRTILDRYGATYGIRNTQRGVLFSIRFTMAEEERPL